MGLTRIRAEQISNIDYKQAVRVVTTTNIASLAGGAPSVVDGVSLQLNNRVLVAGQSTASQNGIYVVQTLGTGENGTWVRATDANQTGEIEPGMVVMVTEGTTYADTPWKLTTNGEIIIGTTALTFVQFSSGSPGGSTTQIQFNNANTFAGSSSLTWSGTELYVNGAANVTGNITANYFFGNGSQLTGLPAGYANANAVAYGESGWAGNIIPSGNTVYDLGSSTNRWKDIWLANSTIYLGDVRMSAEGNNLMLPTNTLVGENPVVTEANGSVQLTGNISVDNVTATGNISGNYFVGNGSQLTGISTSTDRIFSGTSNVDIASANADVTVSVAGTPNVAVFSSSGLTVTGTITGNGIPTTTTSNTAPANPEQGDVWIVGNTGVQLIYFTSGGNSQWAEMEAAQSFSSTGGDYGNTEVAAYLPTYSGNIGDGSGYVFGNGSQLTGLPASYGNANVTTLLSDGSVTSNITTSANVSGGNVISSGIVSAVGNITGDYILGNGSQLTGIITSVSNISSGNSNVNVVSSGGNVTVGINGSSDIAVFSLAGLDVIGHIQATANVTGQNLVTEGNVSGNYILGNGSQLTGISTSTTKIFNGNSEANIGTSGGNANISIGGTSNVAVFANTGLSITGSISASGNISAGNGAFTGNVTVNNGAAVAKLGQTVAFIIAYGA